MVAYVGSSVTSDQTLSAEARTRQRDQAASDLVRALLIVNGGGAAALLAFLQAIWASHQGLAKPTIAAMVIMAFGAAMGAAFHLFRYQASWHHQQGNKAKWAKFRRFYLGSASLSLIAFLAGIGVVACGAWSLLP
jgi:hypothetical protein